MSFTEVDLFGVYVAPISLMMVGAWFVTIALRRVAGRFGLLQYVWHPALFVFSTFGYDRADLASGLAHRRNLTPPEWSRRDEQTTTELKTRGTVPPFEKEYCRKDGSRVPVLIGLSRFEERGNEGVAFVVDLTERKQAEEALRESEYKLRQITQTVPGLVWSNEPDGEPTHINQRMLDYSGLPY
jgi:PAS domain S-box-containing protein